MKVYDIISYLYLQKTGRIKQNISAEFIITWLSAHININTIIFDPFGLFDEGKCDKLYINLMLTSFDIILKPS